MFLVSSRVATINKFMRLGFHMFINEKQDFELKKRAQGMYDDVTISYFMSMGTQYFNLKTNPMLKVEIGIDTKDKIFLTQRNLYFFLLSLKEIRESIVTKDLFYKRNGELYLNQDINRQLMKQIQTSSHSILIGFSILESPDNEEIKDEGIVIMIDEPSKYCLLSYEDLDFLIYTLENVNLPSMAMNAIQLRILAFLAKMKPEAFTKQEPLEEEKTEVPVIPKKSYPSIPNI